MKRLLITVVSIHRFQLVTGALWIDSNHFITVETYADTVLGIECFMGQILRGFLKIHVRFVNIQLQLSVVYTCSYHCVHQVTATF